MKELETKVKGGIQGPSVCLWNLKPAADELVEGEGSECEEEGTWDHLWRNSNIK